MTMFTSPITGGTVSAKLTSPTYSLTKTSSPQNNAVTHLVTSLGGTQTDVVVHSADVSFSHRYIWPAIMKLVGAFKTDEVPVGHLTRWPTNRWIVATKKGTLCTPSGYADIVIETVVTVPAGAPSYGPQNIAAALSAHIGLLNADSDEIYASIVNSINPL